METFKIDKDIPLPSTVRKLEPGQPERRYPWYDMTEVGDSFFVPCEETSVFMVQNSIKSAASQFGRAFNPRRQFTTRRVNGGLRCWRVR